jgi:hypothetical protein
MSTASRGGGGRCHQPEPTPLGFAAIASARQCRCLALPFSSWPDGDGIRIRPVSPDSEPSRARPVAFETQPQCKWEGLEISISKLPLSGSRREKRSTSLSLSMAALRGKKRSSSPCACVTKTGDDRISPDPQASSSLFVPPSMLILRSFVEYTHPDNEEGICPVPESEETRHHPCRSPCHPSRTSPPLLNPTHEP